MKQNESFPYLALLVVLLCAGMLVSLIYPSRTFSAAENRELQQRVMPWEASLLDRSYQDAASAFVSDQFPGREGWMQMRSDILAALHDRRVEDVWDALRSHQQEAIYFRSDHHWTPLGAKYAAEVFLDQPLDAFTSVDAVSGFYGSLARQIAWTHAQDDLQLQLPKEETPYTVEDPSAGTTSTTLYAQDALSSADPYTVFFGGNAPLLRVDSALANGKRLLVIKDSYANAFIPYLIPYYEEIVIVDPRYYYDDLDELIESEEISETLFLFNMNTFCTDDSLQQMLGR